MNEQTIIPARASPSIAKYVFFILFFHSPTLNPASSS